MEGSLTFAVMSLLWLGMALALARTVPPRREPLPVMRPPAEHACWTPGAAPVVSRRGVAKETREMPRARWTS